MLNFWRRSADLMFASHGLGNLILLFYRLGNSTAAATLNGTITKSFESNSLVKESPDVIARLRRTLGEAAFDEASRRGATMTLHEATDYALGEIAQALVAAGVTEQIV
jgi:hypothetical protein